MPVCCHQGDNASARSLSFLTSPVTIVGVRKMTISVFVVSSSWFRKTAPITGIPPKNGTLRVDLIFSSLISPPMTIDTPFLTMTVVSASEVSTTGIVLLLLVVKLLVTELTSGLIFMVTKPSSWMVGVTYSLTPTSMKLTLSAVVVGPEGGAVVVVVTYGSVDPTRIFASLLLTAVIRGLERMLVFPTVSRASITAV